MTEAPVPDPGPRELPGLDVWWDGTQWQRIGAPAAPPPPAHPLATPRDAPPPQNPVYRHPAAAPWDVPYGTRPRILLGAHRQPTSLALHRSPPRRSRINNSLWAVTIVGVVFLASTFAHSMGWGTTAATPHTFVNIPVVAPAGAAGALPLESAEEFAAAYDTHRDADGSYVGSAQEITRAFGAEIKWAEYGAPIPRPECRIDDHNPASVLAWYCGAEPYLIRVNRVAYDMPDVIYMPVFVDAVKHELAHLIIQQRCGRSKPAAGTVEEEGVTNSYAVLYLGADRKALTELSSTFPEYALSTRTDEVAMWIHSGVCWFESSSLNQ